VEGCLGYVYKRTNSSDVIFFHGNSSDSYFPSCQYTGLFPKQYSNIKLLSNQIKLLHIFRHYYLHLNISLDIYSEKQPNLYITYACFQIIVCAIHADLKTT